MYNELEIITKKFKKNILFKCCHRFDFIDSVVFGNSNKI